MALEDPDIAAELRSDARSRCASLCKIVFDPVPDPVCVAGEEGQ